MPILDQYSLWKNGRFRFHDATIQHIMREVSRWYDVDIIYAKTIPEKDLRPTYPGKPGYQIS